MPNKNAQAQARLKARRKAADFKRLDSVWVPKDEHKQVSNELRDRFPLPPEIVERKRK